MKQSKKKEQIYTMKLESKTNKFVSFYNILMTLYLFLTIDLQELMEVSK